jgi:exopolyphosphatase/guanosine-5'-triphosphate,3'-diphosphate pyrophosphatase
MNPTSSLRRDLRHEPVAVIDIGSNSARLVVYRLDPHGHLRVLANTRAALRLVLDVDEARNLSDEAVARMMEALRDFRAMALGAGAARIVGVATAALRDAANGRHILARIRRELGLRLEIIDGEMEAHYGFVGAVRDLPVERGFMFDLGGGSVQVSRFRDRRLLRSWSLPLGSLRLSHAFLRDDPPGRGEIRRLKRHVCDQLEEAGIPLLKPKDQLIGTGGTMRNLAKMDGRAHGYPITRVHGYVLARRRVRELAALLAQRPFKKRGDLPGLSNERGDSIVGGALVVEALMERVDALAVRVSGQGVREGVVYSLLSDGLPPVRAVREASIASLTAQFASWDADSAWRRVTVATALLKALEPRAAPQVREALEHAAVLLDIGRSVDFFSRYEHVADIVVAADLKGFSHREVALLAAIIRRARDENASVKAYSPLLDREDRSEVEQAAVLLALADDIEERCPRGAKVAVECRLRRGEAVVSVPAMAGWRLRDVGPRFERVFDRALTVQAGCSP